MREMKSLTLNGITYDSFVDQTARESGGGGGYIPEITATPTTDGYWIAVDGEDICFIRHGNDGDDGVGIYSIERTNGNGAAGTTDTYTITYTDERTETFTVYNGKDGAKGDTPERGIDYWTPADKEEIKSFIDEDVADLETLLRNILYAIQEGGTPSSTIAEIEQLIVSYLENTSVEEVEA